MLLTLTILWITDVTVTLSLIKRCGAIITTKIFTEIPCRIVLCRKEQTDKIYLNLKTKLYVMFE